MAEVTVTDTIGAEAAVNTQLIAGTFTAFFIAFRAGFGTFRTASAADTYVIRAQFAGFAVVTEISVSADTLFADIASAADFFIGTVRTFFAAVRADRSTL